MLSHSGPVAMNPNTLGFVPEIQFFRAAYHRMSCQLAPRVQVARIWFDALSIGVGTGRGWSGGSFRVQGSGFRVQSSGFRIQGSGFRVQGSGFRVQGSGCRV